MEASRNPRLECPKRVDLRHSLASRRDPRLDLAQIPPAELHIPVLGQLPPTDLSFGNALEPGPLSVAGFNTPLWGGPLGEQPLEHAPRHSNHAAVLADLDPELHRLPLGLPAGVLGNVGLETVTLALYWFEVRSDEKHAPLGRGG